MNRLRIPTVALICGALLGAGTAYAQHATTNTILIGHSGPLTGANQEFGIDVRNGALAYFDKINQTGGVNGRKIELLSIDDANDTKRSGANAKTLIEEKGALALFGYASATLSQPALPTVEANKVPFFGPLTGAEPMRKFNPYVYNVRASYADELEKIVDYYTTTGMKSFAILYYDDAVGNENLAAVEVALAKRGLKPVAVASVKRNQTDLGSAVASVVKATPDVIVATTLYRTTADFILAAKKAGSASQYASTSFVGATALAKALGAAAPGVVVSQVVPPFSKSSVQVVKEYQQAMEKKFGNKEYSFTSLEAYIGAKVLTEAIRRAGANVNRETLRKALDSIKNYDAGGYIVNFSAENHNGSRFVELTAISGQGRFSY